MKVKELIRKLKEFDENLEVTISSMNLKTGFNDVDIFNKNMEFYRGDLNILPTPIVDVVTCVKDNKGKYLIIDINESDFYTGQDFAPR